MVSASVMKGLNDKKHAAISVNVVTQIWSCLNIKTKGGWVLLNGRNREPFSPTDYPKFKKMLKLAEQFKYMNVLGSTSSGHVMCLTSDTSNALNVTLTGLVSLVKLLLSLGSSYILPGNFPSDRLGTKCRIYRQLDVAI